MITTRADKNIIVFNPLARVRTDIARLAAEAGPHFHLRDAATGKDVPHQTLADGTIIFIATNVPSLGYRTYTRSSRREKALTKNPDAQSPKTEMDESRLTSAATGLENQFYRIAFEPATGAITSIRDKQLDVELVDQSAPNRFNEYRSEERRVGKECRSRW